VVTLLLPSSTTAVNVVSPVPSDAGYWRGYRRITGTRLVVHLTSTAANPAIAVVVQSRKGIATFIRGQRAVILPPTCGVST
jgi:hypothetical protein